MRAVILAVIAGCTGGSHDKPPAPPPPPPKGELRVTETPEGSGLRLRVAGTDIAMAKLPLPSWAAIIPTGGTFDVAVDLAMPSVTTRDYRVAKGDATLHCAKCTVGGGSGDAQTAALPPFPTFTIDRLDARVVVGDGHADLVTWTVESKDLAAVVTAHVDLAATLGDSKATICIRLRPVQNAVGTNPQIQEILASSGIAVDANGFLAFKLVGPLDALEPEGYGCDGATRPSPPPSPSPSPVTDLDKQFADGIVIVDATHRTITSALVDTILGNPMAIAKGARVVPFVKDGKAAGFKLYAIRPSSLFARLGLQNGDILRRVNGFELTSADRALEVYTKLRTATSISVDLERAGSPITLAFTITP